MDSGLSADNNSNSRKGIVMAKFDYRAKEASEFSMAKGDKFMLINDTGQWWLVQKMTPGSEAGYVPSNYMKRERRGIIAKMIPKLAWKTHQLPNIMHGCQGENRTMAHKCETAFVRHEYYAKNLDELSLKKDTKVEVLEKKSDGWWLVKTVASKGWYPANFLSHQLTDRQSDISSTAKTPASHYTFPSSETRHLSDENAELHSVSPHTTLNRNQTGSEEPKLTKLSQAADDIMTSELQELSKSKCTMCPIRWIKDPTRKSDRCRAVSNPVSPVTLTQKFDKIRFSNEKPSSLGCFLSKSSNALFSISPNVSRPSASGCSTKLLHNEIGDQWSHGASRHGAKIKRFASAQLIFCAAPKSRSFDFKSPFDSCFSLKRGRAEPRNEQRRGSDSDRVDKINVATVSSGGSQNELFIRSTRSFDARSEDELNVASGEKLKVLLIGRTSNQSDSKRGRARSCSTSSSPNRYPRGEWLKVENSYGQSGLIPMNIVSIDNDPSLSCTCSDDGAQPRFCYQSSDQQHRLRANDVNGEKRKSEKRRSSERSIGCTLLAAKCIVVRSGEFNDGQDHDSTLWRSWGSSSLAPEETNPSWKNSSTSGLQLYDWYFGMISRQEADYVLDQYGADGDFLVRESTHSAEPSYSISMKRQRDKNCHFRVFLEEGVKFRIGRRIFTSMHSLISYYQQHPIFLDHVPLKKAQHSLVPDASCSASGQQLHASLDDDDGGKVNNRSSNNECCSTLTVNKMRLMNAVRFHSTDSCCR